MNLNPFMHQNQILDGAKNQNIYYRLGTVNSKSFVGKVLLRIKWKIELTYVL